jgi:hypothetical protein
MKSCLNLGQMIPRATRYFLSSEYLSASLPWPKEGQCFLRLDSGAA